MPAERRRRKPSASRKTPGQRIAGAEARLPEQRAGAGAASAAASIPKTLIPETLSSRCLLPLLVLWAVLLGCTAMQNFDIWWHLRTGYWMLEHGTVPWSDLFTFTSWDRPWIDLHWGFQLLAVGLYAAGGVPLLVLTKAACLGLTVAVLWHASEWRSSLPGWARVACWCLPVICLSGRAVVRPEMLSLVLLALWLWILVRLDERPRLIWLLPLVQVVWVNCHGLFVLGLVTGAAWLIDRLARTAANGRWGLQPLPAAGPEVRTILRAGLLTGLACLVNPYFEAGLLFPLELYRKFSVDQQLYASIGEFQRPLDFVLRSGLGNVYLLAQLVLALSTAASFLPLWRMRRVSVFRLLLFAAFGFLGWKATRNTSVFAVVAGMVLASNLGELFALAQAPKPAGAGLLPNRAASGILVLLVLLVVSGVWARIGGEKGPLAITARPHWYGHAAARFAGQQGFPQHAFVAHEGLAAVYIFHNGPERPVFMDGRLEVASRETFRLYRQLKQMMIRGDLRWQEILRDSDGHLPLLLFDSRFSRLEISALLQTPGWTLVFADSAAAVFVEQDVARRLKLAAVSPEPLHRPPGLSP